MMVVEGNSRKELETEGQRVVNAIVSWCEAAKLQILKRKTEVIILKNDANTKIDR